MRKRPWVSPALYDFLPAGQHRDQKSAGVLNRSMLPANVDYVSCFPEMTAVLMLQRLLDNQPCSAQNRSGTLSSPLLCRQHRQHVKQPKQRDQSLVFLFFLASSEHREKWRKPVTAHNTFPSSKRYAFNLVLL